MKPRLLFHDLGLLSPGTKALDDFCSCPGDLLPQSFLGSNMFFYLIFLPSNFSLPTHHSGDLLEDAFFLNLN